ncbi:MAG: nucleotide exchange factor GrpE [bacterium]|nr:nucleotide exchange factor GrpE [bacterium]MDT8395175.1 nucleotide exchange factor GrpE [bacterium]
MKRSQRKGNGDGEAVQIPVADGGQEGGDRAPENAGEQELVTLPLEEYEALRAEAAELKDRYLRAAADFDNFRKRVAKEKEDIVRFANERLIRDLLPVLDNLDRALSAGLDKAGMDSVVDGVRMVSEQLHSLLGSCGLEPVEAVGTAFDPNRHEALGVLPSGEYEEGTVVAEMQKGYSLKGKVLRHSMVHVAGKPAGTGEKEDS